MTVTSGVTTTRLESLVKAVTTPNVVHKTDRKSEGLLVPEANSQSNFITDLNNFVIESLKVSIQQFSQLPDNVMVEKAIVRALAHSTVGEEDMYSFQENLVKPYIMNDFPPIHPNESDPESILNNKVLYQESMKIIELLIDKVRGFSYYAYPMKKDEKSEFPMLIRFTNRVSGKNNITIHKLPLNEFPGPGVVINGLKSPNLFPEYFMEAQWYEGKSYRDTPRERVRKKFQDIMISSVPLLKKATFGFFRGVIVVREPESLKIDRKSYALVIFNDHFQNPSLSEAFLVPDDLAVRFLKDPINTIRGAGTPCHPIHVERRFKDRVLNLTWASNIGGMNRAFPIGFYCYPGSEFINEDGNIITRDLYYHEADKKLVDETKDIDGHMHMTHLFGGYWSEDFPLENLLPFEEAHHEVADATFISLALIHNFNEAFRLYCLGYDDYENTSSTKGIKFKEYYRLHEQLLKWRESQKVQKEGGVMLVPKPRGKVTSFNKELVEEVGIIDASLLAHHRKNVAGLTITKMLPTNSLMDYSLDTRKSELKDWLWFHSAAYKNSADLVFMPAVTVKPLLYELFGITRRT